MTTNHDVAPRYTNRLINASSPYLLQHAHNPVNWQPWDDAALAQAHDEDKPIFLSVGYSTCHWCHVMEAESFEDEAIASLLNEHFVAIKVDREERPDIDEIYMKAVQMTTGSGGWPLSVFLTPEGKPFYGGTYFPPESMYGRPSFRHVLLAISEAWQKRRTDILGSADQIGAVLGESEQPGATVQLTPDALETAYGQLSGAFDETHGGFGAAPKFPQPTTLMLLLNHFHRTGDEKALAMVTQTLDGMAAGGIHDHLGGGFHRYATDRAWLVPHFEKMLYDQALLSKVYVQAYQVTDDTQYAAVARDIFDYVLRDLTDPAGGFYAAEDADSEGHEGIFYVWDPDEIEEVLGAAGAAQFCAAYGVTRQGNFEGGKSILHTVRKVDDELTQARAHLFERRSSRVRPHRDDKIITGWNGLMIGALAYGGAVLAEDRYLQAATDAASFVLDRLIVAGRLRRYCRADRAVGKACLDDHAFLILGLIDLYEASFAARWLAEAQSLNERMIDLFTDEGSGFFLTGHDAERLLVRSKPGYDGTVPGGNSAAALALLKLGHMTKNRRFLSLGQSTLAAYAEAMDKAPLALTAMLVALDFHLGPVQEIVLTGAEDPAEGQTLAGELRRHFLPRAVVLFRPPGREGGAIEALCPFAAALGPVQGRAAAYVCADYACRAPVTTSADFRQILRGFSRKD
jgi:uncharacterized protein